LKVLHLSAGNLYGGVETFLTTLARLRHQAPEMEPEFGLCFSGRLWDELADAGVPVHDLGRVRFSRPWTVLRARQRLRRLLGTVRYDVVVCHMSWIQVLFGAVTDGRGTALVAYMHGPRSGSWLERAAGRRRPRLVIGPSRHTVESYRPLFRGVPMEVLNYPIPPQVAAAPDLAPEERQALRRQLGAETSDVVILQASRIEAWKGPDLVLKALGRLRDRPGWVFWLAGGVQRPSEQPYYDALCQIVAELGIAGRVRFLGQRSDVGRLMRAADLYCQGNRGPEGFGLSFLEAGFCGLPVVTTDLGAACEVIDPETGILVPPGEDPAGLAEALGSLLADPDRRAGLACRAREKAVRLGDPHQQIQRLARILAGSRMTPAPNPQQAETALSGATREHPGAEVCNSPS
jgi:glycosyltransferase involved in cell wall biosynthesis